MEVSLSLKEFFFVLGFIFSFAGGYWTLKLQGKSASEKLDDFKTFKEFVYKELKEIDSKCDEMIKEKSARESFVSIELYQSERKHLTESVREIKEQNSKILDMMTKFIGGSK